MITATKGTTPTKPNVLMFPSDIVPDDEEAKENWMHQWVDSIYNYGTYCVQSRDNINFAYAQGHAPVEDFDHVTKLYCNPGSKLQKVMPAKIRQVNSIARILNDVIGAVDEEDVTFNTARVNSEAVTEKLDHLIEKQTKDLTRFVRQQSGIEQKIGRPLVEGDDVERVDVKKLENSNMTNFQMEDEANISKALSYLLKKKTSAIEYKFSHQVLYNYIITGKMAVDTTIDLDDPDAIPIDSRLLIYDLHSQSPFIQKGRFAGYYTSITPQEVIDHCPNLTEEEAKYVDDLNQQFTDNTITGKSQWWYKDSTFNMYYFSGAKIYWSGLKRKLVKIVPNMYDEENPNVYFVDEDYRKDHEKKWKAKQKEIEDRGGTPEEDKAEFTYRYYKVWFECQKIGEKVYYQCREIPNQLIDGDEPSEQEGPIFGMVDPNPCLVDILKPLQEMKIQCFYALESLLSQPMGKVLVIDEATEEDTQENLYNLRVFRVWKVNSAKEGMENRDPRQQRIEPKEIDMGLSTALNDLMRLIVFIDQSMLNLTGMNEQYLGGTKSDVGLGATKLSYQSAQRALQPYFSNFYRVYEMTLQRLTDLMRPAWQGKQKIAYWAGDKMAQFFNLDPSTIDWENNAKYGVFVQNSVASKNEKNMLMSLAGQLQNQDPDPDVALAIIKMANADSSAEAEQIFEKGIKAMKKFRDEQQQFAQKQHADLMNIEQQKVAAELQTEKEKASSPAKVAIIKGETEREVKQMELDFKKNEGTVKYRNEILLKAADAIIEEERQKAEPEKKGEGAAAPAQ